MTTLTEDSRFYFVKYDTFYESKQYNITMIRYTSGNYSWYISCYDILAEEGIFETWDASRNDPFTLL